MQFIPNGIEEELINKITKRVRTEFALIRLTETMLDKSTIDASAPFRNLGIVDYSSLRQGEEHKKIVEAIMLTKTIQECLVSLYRPKTKKGDPRFCIYGLKKVVRAGEMIYITVYNGQLVIIPLIVGILSEGILDTFFNHEDNEIKAELVELLKKLKSKGPVLSVSPDKSNPKDVGDTLERELGMLPNVSILADFKGLIELKAKREGVNTRDTLFSMAPNWDISKIKSSGKMMITYGYPSKRHTGFIDLYVTVQNEPNNQGLYLEVDDDNGLLHQKYKDENGHIVDTCSWFQQEIKKRLYDKHPETIWLIAEEVVVEGKIHFYFKTAEYTKRPIFSSFLPLVSKGIVTYDWRGRVKPDETGYKDKGHCFRIYPKYRSLLFGETSKIEL